MKPGPERLSIEQAYQENRKALYMYFYSLTGDAGASEDLLQETFLILAADPGRFDAARGSFLGWAKAVGRNAFITYLRRHGRTTTAPEDELEPLAPSAATPEQLFLEREEEDARTRKMAELSRCLDSLPSVERAVVRHKFELRARLDDIARSLGTTRRSISRRYARALQLLRQCLKQGGVEP